MRALVAVCFAFVVQCRPTPPSSVQGATTTLPVIDELAYFDALAARRPDLLASDCYDTLTAKPKYRDAILRQNDSMSALRARTYDDAAKAHDSKWAAAMQSAERSFCAQHATQRGCDLICKAASCDACTAPVVASAASEASFTVAGYSLCDFVAYQVGPPHGATSKIRDWKVFFEFKDERIDALGPETYFAFTRALAQDGFHGDSKIMMSAGRVRYQYNDVIVHADSADDARIAERVGIRIFGDALASRARGLDLESSKSPDGILDWHHYLCAEGKASIPPEGLAFVRER